MLTEAIESVNRFLDKETPAILTIYDVINLLIIIVFIACIFHFSKKLIFLLFDWIKKLFTLIFKHVKKVKFLNFELETKSDEEVESVEHSEQEHIEETFPLNNAIKSEKIRLILERNIRSQCTDMVNQTVAKEKEILKSCYYIDFKIESVITTNLNKLKKTLLQQFQSLIKSRKSIKSDSAVRKTTEYQIAVNIADMCVDKWIEHSKVVVERNNLISYLNDPSMLKANNLIQQYILLAKEVIDCYVFPDNLDLDATDCENIYDKYDEKYKMIIISIIQSIITLNKEKHSFIDKNNNDNTDLINDKVTDMIDSIIEEM